MSTRHPSLAASPSQPGNPGLRGPHRRARRGARGRRGLPLRRAWSAQQTRQASVAAMGLLAAGCAHDLAAPLSSMRLLVDEMQLGVAQAALPAPWQAQLNVLDQQLHVSTGILRRLMAIGQHPGNASRAPLPLAQCLAQAAARQRLLHPRTTVSVDLAGLSGASTVWADEPLRQALAVLLNNAAQAARSGVQLQARRAGAEVEISVLDDGPGYPEHALPQLGHARFSTKPAALGSGLGLVLVRLTVQQLGGDVQFSNRSAGGAHARLRLPLAALVAGAPCTAVAAADLCA